MSDEMVDAYNRAYAAAWRASAPITQAEATAVDRNAVRAGLEAVVPLAYGEGRDDEADALPMRYQRKAPR